MPRKASKQDTTSTAVFSYMSKPGQKPDDVTGAVREALAAAPVTAPKVLWLQNDGHFFARLRITVETGPADAAEDVLKILTDALAKAGVNADARPVEHRHRGSVLIAPSTGPRPLTTRWQTVTRSEHAAQR